MGLLLCASACGPSPEPSPERSPEPTPAVPVPAKIAALDLEGQVRDPLAADDRADALIFVRTDCPISNRYAPELGRIAARFADAPVDLWLVYVDPDETPDRIQAHIADYALPGTPLRDPSQSLVSRAGVRVTPEVAVFDAGGQRRYVGRIDDWYVDYGKSRAEASRHEFIDALSAVVAGRAPTVDAAKAVGCPLPPLD